MTANKKAEKTGNYFPAPWLNKIDRLKSSVNISS